MGDLAYIDGELFPLSEAKIPVLDRGFLYGDGIFETLRVYRNVPFLLSRHLKRLLSAAARLEIKGFDIGAIEVAVESTLAESAIQNGVLKIIITRGAGERGLRFRPDAKGSLIIIATSGISYSGRMYDEGFSAVFVPDERGLADIKSLNMLVSIMAASRAHGQGAEEAFFVRGGFVTEGTMSNVFAVRGGELITPSLKHRILPGITRAHVLELALENGMRCLEADLSKEEIESADEVFITNSVVEVMPIVRLNQKPVADGFPGKVTLRLRERYTNSARRCVNR